MIGLAYTQRKSLISGPVTGEAPSKGWGAGDAFAVLYPASSQEIILASPLSYPSFETQHHSHLRPAVVSASPCPNRFDAQEGRISVMYHPTFNGSRGEL